MKYRFEKYNEEFIAHIRDRHFPSSQRVGSVFTARDLSTPHAVAKFAYELILHADRHIRPYDWPFPWVLVHDCGRVIGLDSLIPIKEIPKGTTIKDETRNKYPVKVAYGIKRRPTQTIVIIAGPIGDGSERNGLHACHTAYPGTYAPDLTKEHKCFWDEWAFIEEYKRHDKAHKK